MQPAGHGLVTRSTAVEERAVRGQPSPFPPFSMLLEPHIDTESEFSNNNAADFHRSLCKNDKE